MMINLVKQIVFLDNTKIKILNLVRIVTVHVKNAMTYHQVLALNVILFIFTELLVLQIVQSAIGTITKHIHVNNVLQIVLNALVL